MYRGFNINFNFKINHLFNELLDPLYNRIGKEIYNNSRAHIEKGLDAYLLNNSVLDGSSIQADWFPNIKADVFISHSHGDEAFALTIAGWLKRKFNLTAFIDSCVWGYSDDLLNKLNDKYSKNTDGNFNYEKSKFAASHVHIMLSTALNKMIDSTECLFFLNTSNSIYKLGNDNLKTLSPWIYYETTISKTIRERIPNRIKTIYFSNERLDESVLAKAQDSLKIAYNQDLKHMQMLSVNNLKIWQLYKSQNPNENSLDLLYGLHPAPKKTNNLN